MKKNTLLMTQGSIWKGMVYFFIPIFIGQLFQQLYNVVDSIILGNFVGETALAAVTSVTSLNSLFIGLVSGIFLGAGVLISRYFGAKRKEQMSDAIHTAVAFSIVCGIVLTIVGVLCIRSVIELMNTPDNVIDLSSQYLQIVFGGAIFTVGYNCANGIYQAVGDTKRPLMFLTIACIINIILDFVFILCFNMGVAGAALATVTGQAVSCFLAFFYLFRTNEIYKISLKKIRFCKGFVKDILIYGLPSGIQNSVISLANVFIQSNINAFGDYAMAGSGAFTKIEAIAFIPITSFSFAITTFVSQNLGAGETKRAKKGAIFGIVTAMCAAQLLGIVIFLFSSQLVGLFNDNDEVIAYGVLRANIVTFTYFFVAFSHGSAAVLRGAGKSIIPMITMLVCWCFLRVLYVTIAVSIVNHIKMVFLAYPLSWMLSATVLLIMLKCSNWNKAASFDSALEIE